MCVGLRKYGMNALEDAFARFDLEKRGMLDSSQFEQFAAETGYLACAQEIFRAMGKTRHEVLTHREVVAKCQAVELTLDRSRKTVRMLSAFSRLWDESLVEETQRVLSSSWRVSALDEQGVFAQLQEQLSASGALVSDLLKLFDADADMSMRIDPMEFFSALKHRFHFKGCNTVPLLTTDEHPCPTCAKHLPRCWHRTIWVAEAVFTAILPSRPSATLKASIGYDEFYEFVRGRRHCLDRRTKRVRMMTLRTLPTAAYTLGSIAWDVPTLLAQLQEMMDRAKVSPVDFVRALDKRGTGEVERSNFVAFVGEFFGQADKHLWQCEVEPIAAKAFDDVARTSRLEGTEDVLSDKVAVAAVEAWVTMRAPTGGDPPLKADANKADSKELNVSISPNRKMAREESEARARLAHRVALDLAHASARGKSKASKGYLLIALKDCVRSIEHERAQNGGKPWQSPLWRPARPLVFPPSSAPFAMEPSRRPQSASSFYPSLLHATKSRPSSAVMPVVQHEMADSQQGLPARSWSAQGLRPTSVGYASAWRPVGQDASSLRRPTSATALTAVYSLKDVMNTYGR